MSIAPPSIALIVILAAPWAAAGGESAPDLTPKPPTFQLELNLAEFTLLNNAMIGGLQSGGAGAVGFETQIAVRDGSPAWFLTFEGFDPVRALREWANAETANLLAEMDPANLAKESAFQLGAAKSLNAKIREALANPNWESVTLAGTLMEAGGAWRLEGGFGALALAAGDPMAYKGLDGRKVLARGSIRKEGELTLGGIREFPENRLEAFIMSYCAHGQKAVIELMDRVNRASGGAGEPPVELDVRYIFYKGLIGGEEKFFSLYGDRELRENVIQMVIRDAFPDSFEAYFRLRAQRPAAAWDELAAEAGLDGESIGEIRKTLDEDSESLIEREYEYATAWHGIYDQCPTFVWEGAAIGDLALAEPLRRLETANR